MVDTGLPGVGGRLNLRWPRSCLGPIGIGIFAFPAKVIIRDTEVNTEFGHLLGQEARGFVSMTPKGLCVESPQSVERLDILSQDCQPTTVARGWQLWLKAGDAARAEFP
jgi:hypothetical protein